MYVVVLLFAFLCCAVFAWTRDHFASRSFSEDHICYNKIVSLCCSTVLCLPIGRGRGRKGGNLFTKVQMVGERVLEHEELKSIKMCRRILFVEAYQLITGFERTGHFVYQSS